MIHRPPVELEGRFTLRAYQPGDEISINRGFNAAFGLQRSLDEWEWKFPESPDGRWILVVVDEDNEVVAHFGALPLRLQIDGRLLRVGQTVDVYRLRRPDLTRSAVFVALAREFFGVFGAPQHLALVYGFPSDYHLRLGMAKLGYAEPAAIPLWTRQARAPLAWWTRHVVREGFDAAAVDRLWQKSAPRYPVAAVRDSAYLLRRYGGRPGVEYLHLSAWSDGNVGAWLVLRHLNGVAYWTDLVWNGEDERALVALDAAADRIARRWRARRSEMWLANDPAAAALLMRRRWSTAPHPDLQLTVVSFLPGVDANELGPRFYLTMGDSDLI